MLHLNRNVKATRVKTVYQSVEWSSMLSTNDSSCCQSTRYSM